MDKRMESTSEGLGFRAFCLGLNASDSRLEA